MSSFYEPPQSRGSSVPEGHSLMSHFLFMIACTSKLYNDSQSTNHFHAFFLLTSSGDPVMTLIDSTAAFEKRCDELRPGLKDVFSASFVTTFSELAFAVGTPQSPVTDTVMQRFADNLFGGPCTIGDCSVIKRIHFEATTLVMADLRLQVTSGDMSEPLKKLPYVEKIRRINQQMNRITGISHKNEQQPAHSLIDTCFQIVETGSLIYIAPSKCSSRDSEIAAESKAKTKQVLTLEQGSLKTSSTPELPPADVGTELKLMFALQRRGLAFDLVNLVSWNVHVEWTNKLYRALMTEVASGFHPITLSQLLKADRELFMILASEETGPLKPDPGNDPPLDAAIVRLMLDPRVNIHLTPMPKLDKRPVSDPPRDRDDKPSKFKKGEQKKSPAQLPDALKGLNPKTKEGKPACWHFNLAKGCNNDVKKGRCRFGFHVCMRCGKKEHGASSCTH